MSAIYGFLPAGSLLFSTPYRCRPEPYVWQPPGIVFQVAWSVLAVTTGLAGLSIYKVNDQEANTVFVGLCFLFGTGWAISNRICNQYATLVYVMLTLYTAYWLYDRLRTLGGEEAKKGQRALIPLLVWLLVALALSAYAVTPLLLAKSS